MLEHQLCPDPTKTLKQRCALRLLACFGWRVIVPPLPGPRGVLIVYPHTTNWDFFIGMLAKWALGEPLRWLGKEAIFRGPIGFLFGRILRSWGGEPVERHAASGSIERIARRFHEHDWYWLALSPEGTRRFRPNWRSGFYYITLAAKVPLALAYIDYPKKLIGVAGYVQLTGDKEVDMAAVRQIYADKRGLYPEMAAPIAW